MELKNTLWWTNSSPIGLAEKLHTYADKDLGSILFLETACLTWLPNKPSAKAIGSPLNKTTSENIANKSEWQVVGEMVDKFKKCVQKEILHDGNPVIPMITSVQSNRYGITNNRTSQNIVDDESIVSLSDRITQFCSHMFILRNKTNDEIETEGGRFGTHKLINVKSRHLGSDIAGAVEPVRIGDALRKNAINLDFNNFNITERGDLRDIARMLDGRRI